MIGDAISHAVLPGIVIAFLVSGSRNHLPTLLGAALVGLLTTVLIELFHKKTRLQMDASIGITFTWLFALGVILITFFADAVDLDQECVLYGEIALIPLDALMISGTDYGPRALWIALLLFALVLAFILRGYRALFYTSFNPEYALALGLGVGIWHYLLMGMVSFTTVVAFESVGAILVVALMVAPPATAYLLTGKLKTMLWLTALFGFLSSFLGYYLAVWLDGSIAGGIATASGFWFLVAMGFKVLWKIWVD